jgi:Family of unknown function (DUF5675)
VNWVVQRQPSDGTATMGELLIGGTHACFTMEPASPIQAGTYDLAIDYSPDFQRLMIHVLNVPPCPPDRGIRIHWGSIPPNTLGCLLTGETEGKDFLGHTVDEFNILFQQLQEALTGGPVTITYLEPSSA